MLWEGTFGRSQSLSGFDTPSIGRLVYDRSRPEAVNRRRHSRRAREACCTKALISNGIEANPCNSGAIICINWYSKVGDRQQQRH